MFDLVVMGTHAVILDMSWLCLHNPHIDWQISEITISQCRYKSNYIVSQERKYFSSQAEFYIILNELLEDSAQASELMKILIIYKAEYWDIFYERPKNEALSKH